jgi:type I restriction enzyme S subunit
MMKSPPCGWAKTTIGALADVARGSSPRPIADQRYFVNGSIPWIKIADATKSEKYLYETKEKVNEYGASFSRLLPAGSLIVAASGTLGYTQILGVPGCVHDGWLYVTNLCGADRDYIYYFLQWKKQHFYNSAYGAAIQNINTEILRNTEIALPPLEAQKRIGEILSAYDDLIENNTRRIKLLEQMAQMLYQEWFVNFRFPGHEKVKMVESEVGSVPETFTVVKLGEALDFENGKAAIPTEDGAFPLYGSNGIIGRCSTARYENAVVIGRVGAYCGSTMFCKSGFWASDNTIVAKPASIANLSVEHVYWLLQEMNLRRYAGGAAQPLLTQSVIRQILITVPDKRTSEVARRVLEPLMGLIANFQTKNSNLRVTRDLILPKLVSGEVSVERLEEEALTQPV